MVHRITSNNHNAQANMKIINCYKNIERTKIGHSLNFKCIYCTDCTFQLFKFKPFYQLKISFKDKR